MTIRPQSFSTQVVLKDKTFSNVLSSSTTFYNGAWSAELTKGGPVRAWKSKIRLGTYAGTNLTVVDRKYKVKSLHAKGFLKKAAYSPGETDAWFSIDGMPFLTGPAVPVSSATKADSLALTKFAKRQNELLTTFQGGVFVGELAQTIRQIRHPAMALRRGINDYLKHVHKRAKKIRRRRDMINMVTGTYLEYTFGWQPLVSDLDSGAEVLAEYITDVRNREVKTLMTTGSDRQAKEDSDWYLAVSNSSPCVVDVRGMRTHTTTVKYLGCFLLEPSTRKSVLTKIGLNLSNFVPTLWELVPWSFVVDYFTNVGDCLTGLANMQVQPNWVMRWQITDDVYEVRDFRNRKSFDTNAYNQTIKPGYWYSNARSITRTKYSGTLIPSFRFEIPGETSMKWINLAALGAQLALTRGVTTDPKRLRLTLLRKGTF